MAVNKMMTTIKSVFSDYNPGLKPVPEGLKEASVLIPFYPSPEGLSLVFMKRPDDQGPHGGQISFPGGAKEESDLDDLSVALRETEEEYGVDKSKIEIWGRLNPQKTVVSSFWVTPFVGTIPYPANFQPNADEVERLIIIPFSHLTDRENFSLGTYRWKGIDVPSYLFEYAGDTIWGLTARILFNLITLLNTGDEPSSPWPPT